MVSYTGGGIFVTLNTPRLVILYIFLISALLFWTGFYESIYAQQPINLSICEIQGDGYSSPHIHEYVRTTGIVHTDLDDTWKSGFFIQEDNCDSNSNTSEGIYIYISAEENTDIVSQGDYVEVTGTVNEYYGLTEVIVTPNNVKIISSGNPLPNEERLNPPFNNETSKDYFESIEGMQVSLEGAITVGPTDADDRTWIVNTNLGINRVFRDDPMGTGEIICLDDAGRFEVTPEVKTGDTIQELKGALDYSYGLYCIQLNSAPIVSGDVDIVTQLNSSTGCLNDTTQISVSTFNLANLFDTHDDLEKDDQILSKAEYQRRIHKRALAIHDVLCEPDILAIQEVENLDILQELVSQSEILGEYGIVWEDSPDNRGLDLGLVYLRDRLRVIDSEIVQGCTDLIDGLGPDGNLDIQNPENEVTCDVDGDEILDGNRLFSRPPLLVKLEFCKYGCELPAMKDNSLEEPIELVILVNHWKSKTQDTDTVEYTLPRRIEQAQFVANIVEGIYSENENANLIVLGDLNDYINSQSLAVLEAQNLVNLMFEVEKDYRYSYIYRGVSQVLDHVLLLNGSILKETEVTVRHINSDYPYASMSDNDSFHRSSDHDPVYIRFKILSEEVRLPIILR